MSYKNAGTCGLCGGTMLVPTIWYGIYPPVPRCERCGAIPRNPGGPVIDTVRPDTEKWDNYPRFRERMNYSVRLSDTSAKPE